MAAGSFYTEPGGVAHFALTKEEPVVVYITGFGANGGISSRSPAFQNQPTSPTEFAATRLMDQCRRIRERPP
jgi:hypothetical protein